MFVASENEVITIIEKLQKIHDEHRYKEIYGDFRCYPLFAALPIDGQRTALKPLVPVGGKNVRKIILATNIAETSLAIIGITQVIDCAVHKESTYSNYVDFNFNFIDSPSLETKNSALIDLVHLAALDQNRQSTNDGRKMIKLPIHP